LKPDSAPAGVLEGLAVGMDVGRILAPDRAGEDDGADRLALAAAARTRDAGDRDRDIGLALGERLLLQAVAIDTAPNVSMTSVLTLSIPDFASSE
jgi:hypothetical protein